MKSSLRNTVILSFTLVLCGGSSCPFDDHGAKYLNSWAASSKDVHEFTPNYTSSCNAGLWDDYPNSAILWLFDNLCGRWG